MNKLNTFLSFVLLSFCLLINVSSAIEFTTEGISKASATKIANIDRDTLPNMVIAGDYTLGQGFELWDDVTGDNDTLIAYNSFLQACTDKGYTVFGGAQGSSKALVVIDGNCDVGSTSLGSYFAYAMSQGQNIYYIDRNGYYNVPQVTQYQITSDGYFQLSLYTYSSVGYLSSNKHFKTITIANSTAVWDGTYLSEQPPIYLPTGGSSSEPETPTMPTNAEIASAVQLFYNSDYYKNNKDFSDFIVLYDKTTGYYSFIGHTVPEWLIQVIIPPDYRYKSYMFDVQWWMFELSENSGAPAYGSNYYLYTTDSASEEITYNGVNTLSNLVGTPWAVSNTVIVYSTHDYLVRTYVKDESTGDYNYTDGTIAGDQYTYDEDLDITDNEYNPLDNFITTDYPSTLVGNADFDSFMKEFNENKDFLILPPDGYWIVLACSALFDFFGSFIVMCTVFIILERIMRG